MNVDGGIQRFAITRALARVIAHATMHRRERIVFCEGFPGRAELARLRQREPSLDVFSRRARIVAGRQQVNVNWSPGSDGAGSFLARQIDQRCDIGFRVSHLIVSVRQRLCFAIALDCGRIGSGLAYEALKAELLPLSKRGPAIHTTSSLISVLS